MSSSPNGVLSRYLLESLRRADETHLRVPSRERAWVHRKPFLDREADRVESVVKSIAMVATLSRHDKVGKHYSAAYIYIDRQYISVLSAVHRGRFSALEPLNGARRRLRPLGPILSGIGTMLRR